MGNIHMVNIHLFASLGACTSLSCKWHEYRWVSTTVAAFAASGWVLCDSFAQRLHCLCPLGKHRGFISDDSEHKIFPPLLPLRSFGNRDGCKVIGGEMGISDGRFSKENINPYFSPPSLLSPVHILPLQACQQGVAFFVCFLLLILKSDVWQLILGIATSICLFLHSCMPIWSAGTAGQKLLYTFHEHFAENHFSLNFISSPFKLGKWVFLVSFFSALILILAPDPFFFFPSLE